MFWSCPLCLTLSYTEARGVAFDGPSQSINRLESELTQSNIDKQVSEQY